ncbi:MAG: YfhO family protein [Candidatus Curtissbacteria bacterium]|nr:YfhO family protein [Candidatus Curtissbacteria bacterium]
MERSFYNNILGLLVTVLLILAFFLPGAFKGKFPIPADALINLYHPLRDISQDGYSPGRFPAKNTLITDPVLQTYPWRFTAVSDMKSGNFPLWNPYNFSGQPLSANIQSAPFQITNILFLVLPFKIAWSIQIILPEILLGVFIYFYLRFGLNLSIIPSVFGGFIAPFTGFFVAWMTWGTVVTTAMWLPLILLSIEQIFKKSPLWIIILILSVSQTIFSGHWQTALYVLGASTVYIIFKIAQFKDYKRLGEVVFALIVSVLITGVQILPAFEFLKYSARGLDQAFTSGRQDWFLPPQHLIQMIAPDFFGNPATGNYWGIWNYGEFVSFIGIVPLFLVILAFFKRNRGTYFFIFLAVTSLVLALPNPISKIPYLLNLPQISSMQPSRIIFLLDFSLIILAAFGLEFLLKEKKIKKILFSALPIIFISIVLALAPLLAKGFFPNINGIDPISISSRNVVMPLFTSILLLLIIFVKKITTKKHYLVLIIFLITAFELFRFSYKFTPFSKLSWVFPQTKTLTYLGSQEKPFRIITTDRRILHPNSSAAYGIESIDGYDPLYLLKYAKFISALQSNSVQSAVSSYNRIITPQKIESNLTNLLNVKYILTFNEFKNPDFVKVFEEGETKTYLNKKSLPRAFFVSSVEKQSTDAGELAKLLDKNFDIASQATSKDFSFPRQVLIGQVKINSYSDSSITLKTSLDKEAPLVLTNINYPGWKAEIDGKETKINEVDFMFQSALIPAGEHIVDFKYKPQSFYNGLYLTLAGIAISIASLIFLCRKKYLS